MKSPGKDNSLQFGIYPSKLSCEMCLGKHSITFSLRGLTMLVGYYVFAPLNNPGNLIDFYGTLYKPYFRSWVRSHVFEWSFIYIYTLSTNKSHHNNVPSVFYSYWGLIFGIFVPINGAQMRQNYL